MSVWYEENVTLKEDRVVIKLKNNHGAFCESVIVPTTYYPLNGEYKVFHYNNTRTIVDEKVLEAFDSVKYKYGFCYENTERLVEALNLRGFEAKSYVGWLFISNTEYPIHHCWVVLEDDIVLDLADDFFVMLSGKNIERFKNKTISEARMLSVDFALAAKNIKNSIRCAPIGTPAPFLYYVGSECEPQQGRYIYNQLIGKYPQHKCERNCDSRGLNKTQRILKSQGLM